MLAFILTRFFLTVLTLLSSAIAVVVNITVDDGGPDPLTGQYITYLPTNSWGGPTCDTCFARVSREELHNGTWHDSTISKAVINSISYTGSDIYVYCAIATSNINAYANSNMTFYIDNEFVGHFEHTPSTGSQAYQYNVLVYSNTSIVPGEHAFMLQNGQEGGVGNVSLTLFDYLVYS
ncbi:hypothetical protein BDQ17DRAFT_1254263 [Cyathus striatus]|nr:hypothetical protein BDQ17DRAFT_1254263 [Cyathus striatus]